MGKGIQKESDSGKNTKFLCVAAKKIFLCVHIFIVVMILLEFGRLAGDVFPLHYQLLNALLALLGLTAIFLLFFYMLHEKNSRLCLQKKQSCYVLHILCGNYICDADVSV